MSYRTICVEIIPDFEARTNEAYLKWRSRYLPDIEKIESLPGYLNEREKAKVYVRNYAATKGVSADDRQLCAEIERILARPL